MTVISLFVMVPVLSEHITLTQPNQIITNKNLKPNMMQEINFKLPKVSTVGNFFTIAFLFAIRITPRAKVTVTTIGRPSGIAATAKLYLNNLI